VVNPVTGQSRHEASASGDRCVSQEPATAKRGGQPIYSATAIETGLVLRLVFHQPLRQTEGLLRSIATVLGLDIAIPDHTTLSRRGGGLTIQLEDLRRGRMAGSETRCPLASALAQTASRG
jgi:hypothetical protein